MKHIKDFKDWDAESKKSKETDENIVFWAGSDQPGDDDNPDIEKIRRTFRDKPSAGTSHSKRMINYK